MEAEQKTVFRGLHRSGALVSHRRCAPPLSHFAPDSLRGSAPLFLIAAGPCAQVRGGGARGEEPGPEQGDRRARAGRPLLVELLTRCGISSITTKISTWKEIAALEQGGKKEQAAAIMLQKERQVGTAFRGRAC